MMVKINLSKERKVLLICILISAFLVVVGIISREGGVLGNVIILSVFIIITPQLIFNYIAYNNLREMESKFPNFLRDLVEATRAGLPLHKAIIFVSHANYGALTPEVKKMANQLTWNVNILKVFEQSKERLKKSKSLTKILRIIIETYKSGGAIDRTLNALSNTLITIQDTEKERRSTLNQYVMAMYVISFIFIGVVVAINRMMVPIFQSMSSSAVAGEQTISFVGNPCTVCYGVTGPNCLPCGIYFNICSIFGIESTEISCYYLALFFSVSIVQALAGGLVAGQIGEGSIIAGTKHSLILLAITFGAFFILVNLGFIGR
jgi:flagellar protein FlaJ